MAFFAGNVLAEDIGIGIENESNVAATATGGDADQQQTMEQWEQQWQLQESNSCATGGAGGKGGEGGDASATGGNSTATGGTAISNPVANGGQSDAKATADVEIGDTTANNKTVVKGVDGKIENTYNNIAKRNMITAQPGPSGSFMNATLIIDDGLWHPLPEGVFTVGELEKMVSSSGYLNRTGFFLSNMLTSPVTVVMHVDEADGDLEDNFEVTVVNEASVKTRTLAESFGIGPYSTSLGAIEALSILKPVMKTHARYITGRYRTRRDGNASGIAVGSGAATSGISGGSNDNRSGSLAAGAIVGYSTAYYNTAFDVDIRAVEVMESVAIVAPAPTSEVEVQEEKIVEPKCDPQQFIDRIAQLKEATAHCFKDCFNNMLLWKQIGDAFADWYECGGRVDNNLLAQADSAYARSEKNCIEGHEADGTKTSSMIGAQQLLHKVKYNRSWCILLMEGPDAQMRYGEKEELPAVPEFYNELKR